MNSRMAVNKLRQVLLRDRPDEIETRWSKRIEGYLETETSKVHYESVLVILDSELDESFIQLAIGILSKAFRNVELNKSKLTLTLWVDGTFDASMYEKHRFLPLRLFNKEVEGVSFEKANSGNVQELDEYIQKKCKSVQKIICILTEPKAVEISEKLMLRGKRIEIIYPSDTEEKLHVGSKCFLGVEKDGDW